MAEVVLKNINKVYDNKVQGLQGVVNPPPYG